MGRESGEREREETFIGDVGCMHLGEGIPRPRFVQSSSSRSSNVNRMLSRLVKLDKEPAAEEHVAPPPSEVAAANAS